jgi:hypothetical protein
MNITREEYMIKFEFESHVVTNEDQYVKEIVVFKFTAEGESWYVPYFHKATKEGGSFWSPSSAGVQIDGKKKYFDGFELDSRHRAKQIIEFLTDRKWEKPKQPLATNGGNYYPHGLSQHPTSQVLLNDSGHCGVGYAPGNQVSPANNMGVAADEQLPF